MSTFVVESRMLRPPCERPEITYPVTNRENLKLLLDGKVPYWVPFYAEDKQMTCAALDNDRPPLGVSGKDWFGVSWTHVDLVGGQTITPNSYILTDMSQWREKVHFPDLDKIDFSVGREETLKRLDPNKMTGYIMQDGLFERLLSLCPVDECLCWMMEEPEDAAAFFNAMADYKIAMIHKLAKEWVPMDFIINSDDWGTQMSLFMAPETFRELILPPMKRIAEAVHSHGWYYICHSCGKCGALAPEMLDIGFCLWESQALDDLEQIQRETAGKLAIKINLDPYVLQNPASTEADIRGYVRKTLMRLGRNGGLAIAFKALTPEIYRCVIQEVWDVSREMYAGREGQPVSAQA